MNFNPKNDFIILPEILAHFAKDLEFKKKNKVCNFCSRTVSYEYY